MIRLTLLSILVIALVACSSRNEGSVTPTVPSQVTPATPASAVITVGKPLKGTFLNAALTYELTAPSTGALVLRLSWDPSRDGARLMLTVADTSFMASAPNWSPVVGRVAVSKGQTYLVKVDEGVDPWDVEDDPFELDTTIE